MRTLLAGLGVAASLAVAYVGCGLSTQGKNVGGFTEVDGGSTGTGGAGGGGTGQPCASEADCPADTDCTTHTCVDKRCHVTLSPPGTEIAAGKVVGDCKRKVCAGSGTVSEVTADDDPPVSPDPCTTKSCSDGDIVTTIVTDNEPCGKDLYCQGGVCIGCELASECDAPPECNTVECTNQQCVYKPIADGMEVEDTEPSDCKHTICKSGMEQIVGDINEDPPPDKEGICTKDECNAAGEAVYTPANQGMECEPMSECADPSKCENGTCAKHPKPAGYLKDDGVDGNCKASFCDGQGKIEVMTDDNDEPQDPDLVDCEVPNCVNGNLTTMKLSDGTACAAGGMRKCCDGVCCANNTDVCVNNMCCLVAKLCGDKCCAANQTCSTLGDGGFTCTP